MKSIKMFFAFLLCVMLVGAFGVEKASAKTPAKKAPKVYVVTGKVMKVKGAIVIKSKWKTVYDVAGKDIRCLEGKEVRVVGPITYNKETKMHTINVNSFRELKKATKVKGEAKEKKSEVKNKK